VLAALHPKMLELAATQANGTHPCFVPPEHTAKVRAAIAPKPMICVEQAIILSTGAAKAPLALRSIEGLDPYWTRDWFLNQFKIPPDETRARWEEGLRILLNIWKSQDGTFSWKGRYFDIPEPTVVPVPIQRPVIGEAR
jgi:hypothetical protein